MKLVIMRHGATVGNEKHCYVGRRSDEPLSEAGRLQCMHAGCFLNIERVYASPLLRARQTARICFPAAEIETVPGLEEFDFGAFEGRTADEMSDDEAYRAWVDGNCEGACPGGEARTDYIERSNTALLELLRKAQAEGQERVIVVAHGGTVMAAFSALARPEEQQDYYAWHVSNAQGYTAEVDLQGQRPIFAHCTKFDTLPL